MPTTIKAIYARKIVTELTNSVNSSESKISLIIGSNISPKANDNATVFAIEVLLLGGGCFWCTEGAFKRMKGVTSALPAYAGGETVNPDYRSVCDGITGHAEIVEVEFDESIITYDTILDVF